MHRKAPSRWNRRRLLGAPVFQAEAATRVAELEIGIAELREAQFAQWVTNQAPVEDTWDAYLEQMKALGIEEYLALYQDAVSAGDES